MHSLFGSIAGIVAAVTFWITGTPPMVDVRPGDVSIQHPTVQQASPTKEMIDRSSALNAPIPAPLPPSKTKPKITATMVATSSSISSTTLVYSDAELSAMASAKYESGEVPVGDGKYTTTGAKKGYIYLCHVMGSGEGGAGVNGPWVHDSTWNFLNKIHVRGTMDWPTAQFSNTILGTDRSITTNGLPFNHSTGLFPIAFSDPAYIYDHNPNTIRPQSLSYTISAHPTVAATPQCMGGEVGIALSGAPIFNGFDAGNRDAPAHELQDACGGHPQKDGEYHYHSMSPCFKDTSITTVLGYALDGFPITGPVVSSGKYMTTDDLDECHGLTSDIVLDGVHVITYHYVMTYDFPYTVGCFRGVPTGLRPQSDTEPVRSSTSTSSNEGISVPPGLIIGGMMPPQEALAACAVKTDGMTCSFVSPHGDVISGVCHTPPNMQALACIPH